MFAEEGGRSCSELDHSGSGLLEVLKTRDLFHGNTFKNVTEVSAVVPFGAQTMGIEAPLEPQLPPEHSRCLSYPGKEVIVFIRSQNLAVASKVRFVPCTSLVKFQFLGFSFPFLFSAGQEGWGGTFPRGVE